MQQPILYKTAAIATGGRAGSVRSTDDRFSASLALPAELGGSGGAGTNPEQLFAAGYAACFASGLQFCAQERGLKIRDVQVTADVGLGPLDTGGFRLTVALRAELAGVDLDTARALVDDTHQKCPYSHATRGNIDVQIEAAVREG